jgi:chemotaxis methyl-accepting protein methylase
MHHNLASASPPAETFGCGVVICRNVLIYLHRPAIDDFLERLRRRMAPGSLLMLGMGEALGPLEGFRPGPAPGTFLRAVDAPFTAGLSRAPRTTSLRDEIAKRR